MNKGGLPILGIGVFVFIGGYLSEEKVLMFIAAFIILAGFGLLAAKHPTVKTPKLAKSIFSVQIAEEMLAKKFQKKSKKTENYTSVKFVITNGKCIKSIENMRT